MIKTIVYSKRAQFLIEDIIATIEKDGMILIKNLSTKDNSELIYISEKLGVPVYPTAEFLKEGTEDGYIYRVEEQSKASSISQTASAFEFHTDGFRANKIPDLVILLLVHQSSEGGESFLVDIEKILPILSEESLNALISDEYRFPSGVKRRILSLNNGSVQVAFNPYDVLGIEICDRKNYNTANLESNLAPNKAVHELFVSLYKPQNKVDILLDIGDCLIFDNRRILHGRTAFQGNRLLKRVWVCFEKEQTTK